jgi:hypothetical protein
MSSPPMTDSRRLRGTAIVNATGPIRQVVHGEHRIRRRYLVIAEGRSENPGHVLQVQWK